MRWLKAESFWIAVGLALVVSGPVCLGDEAPKADEMPSAPSVVAHFHLSGMVAEAPVVDPFGFTVGQITPLKDLVRRLDKASADDKELRAEVEDLLRRHDDERGVLRDVTVESVLSLANFAADPHTSASAASTQLSILRVYVWPLTATQCANPIAAVTLRSSSSTFS